MITYRSLDEDDTRGCDVLLRIDIPVIIDFVIFDRKGVKFLKWLLIFPLLDIRPSEILAPRSNIGFFTERVIHEY